MVTEDMQEKLKVWCVNTGLRIDNDLTEARNDFQTNQSAWFAFRLALAGERKNCFDNFMAQLFTLLNI